jgi:hypothetical protein
MPDPMASSDNTDPPPVAPIEPDFEACCGNGCEPCIFDIYAMERERYFADLRAWQARQARGSAGAGGPLPRSE